MYKSAWNSLHRPCILIWMFDKIDIWTKNKGNHYFAMNMNWFCKESSSDHLFTFLVSWFPNMIQSSIGLLLTRVIWNKVVSNWIDQFSFCYKAKWFSWNFNNISALFSRIFQLQWCRKTSDMGRHLTFNSEFENISDKTFRSNQFSNFNQ